MINTKEKELISSVDTSVSGSSLTSHINEQESLGEGIAQKRLAPIIGVLGAKGGVGTTTVALNLAAALSLNRGNTTIVDANLQQPELAHLTGQNIVHTLSDLLVRKTNFDRPLFEACVQELSSTKSKLNLLSPPLSGEAGVKFNLTDLSDCMQGT
jgi:Mrp family chromosome partitioning ATPase